MFARAVRLFDNPIPEANEALVTNPLNLLQLQGVDQLPQRPSILLGPLAADGAIVGHSRILPFRV